MIITDFLERNARFFSNDVALVEINPSQERDLAVNWREASLVESAHTDSPYRREMTWEDFDRRANRFANLLLSRGFKKGTKVGLLMMNCLEFLPIYFGTLKAGCIVVPMNYRYSSDEILYCLDLADVEVLVFGPEFIERINDAHSKMNITKTLLFVGCSDCPSYAEDLLTIERYFTASAPPVLMRQEDFGAIYFSSGTTGFPKAILHTHRALVHSCIAEQQHHGQTKDDVFLLIPPLYHTGAKMHWFGSLVSGSKAVILKGLKPEWIIRTVTEEHCTIVWLLVPWIQDILDSIERGKIKLNEHLVEQWRLMHAGAQPVPPSLIRRWEKYFPGQKYDTNYGLSESLGPGCVHLGVENSHKVGAIGLAGYGWETKIIGEDKKPVTQGSVGELCVKGPAVMVEYYKNPEATKEVLQDGWLLTGDMAKQDEDGFIYLVDRKKDVIITGGENLYPVEIEDFMRKFDKIKDVAVIGVPDPRLGELAIAIVETKDGVSCTKEEIDEFCNGMPRYKRPKNIIFDTIPRNPTGKIEKPTLRKRYNKVSLVEAQINS